MNHYDPTDPAAEVKYLKALERGKGWPQEYPDPAKVKKGKDWPAAVDAGKKKPPRHVARMMVDPAAPSYRPMTYEGYTIGEVIRAVLIFLAAIGAALLID
jgi:hypothetical protein